jgi:hypothetical protein
VVQPQFLDAEPFENGKAKVFVNASKNPNSVKLPKERWVDKKGKITMRE